MKLSSKRQQDESNPDPLAGESDVPTTAPPRHTNTSAEGVYNFSFDCTKDMWFRHLFCGLNGLGNYLKTLSSFHLAHRETGSLMFIY